MQAGDGIVRFIVGGTLLLLLVGWAALDRVAIAEEPLGLVDWLEARGEDASFAARKTRFEALFPGSPYAGTAEENMRLLVALQAGRRPPAVPSPSGTRPAATFETVQLGWRIVLDRSAQVLGLGAPRDAQSDWRMDLPEGRTVEPELRPTLPMSYGLISAAVLAQKAKQFDDGLYAAVERAVLHGHGAFPGTRLLLQDLATHLELQSEPPADAAASVVHAGLRLGRGWTPNQQLGPPDALTPVLEAFDADDKRSKPLGFYTWSFDLAWIFRQDRMLQTPLARDASLDALLRAFRSSAASRAVYTQWLELVEGLTSPFAYDDVRVALDGSWSRTDPLYLLPPSRAHETELAKRLWGDKPVPEGANLMDLLVDGVRSGRLALTPTRDSGWYDHQTWALEPLLRPERTPEAKRLRFDAAYKAHLEQLFRGLLALTRETHVKQLEFPDLGAYMPPPRVVVRPALTIEPLATYYRRRANAYAFVRRVLEGAFGRGSLRTLRRATPVHPKAVDLDAELAFMERLFRGAAERALREIGSDHARADVDAAVDLAAFDAWRTVLPQDPDLSRDSRMMVPVFYDVLRQRTKVWVFLGWSERPLHVTYVQRPAVVSWTGLWPGVKSRPEIVFEGQHARVAYPVTAEVYVSKLLDRKAFRAHCDRHKTQSAILAHLE